MKKKVLITGVTGTMGFATLKQFAAHLDEFDVRVLARKSDFNENMLKPYAEQIEIVWGDLTDDECLHECVKDMDYILAIGAFVSPMADAHPEECIRTNYGSTLSMLRSIKELGQTDKTHFVFIGSVSMYGDRQTPIHWAKVGDRSSPPFLTTMHLARYSPRELSSTPDSSIGPLSARPECTPPISTTSLSAIR